MKSLPALLSGCLLAVAAASTQASEWTTAETAMLQSLALKQLAASSQPGNRFANNPTAIEAGRKLFFDPRLSRNGQVSCASCHRPEASFTDKQQVAVGLASGSRNTPSLLGVAHNEWYFWDGRKDSLWSQALAPLEDPAEHGLTRVELVRWLLQEPDYQPYYDNLLTNLPDDNLLAELPPQASPQGNLAQLQAWKAMPPAQRQQVDHLFAATGKFIAAYVATLQAPANRLDAGEDAQLTPTEMAGAKLFMGKAQCMLCHSGPLMTNQGFHNIGTGRPGEDSGRAAALDRLRTDRFNCKSEYSDFPAAPCDKLKFLTRNRHAVKDAFKVPGLRGVAATAPYFHDGSKASLRDVVDHYVEASQRDEDTDLPVIRLSDQEKAHLVNFLEML